MKKVINYKVQKEEWEQIKNEAFKKLNAKATIDGFRKGKAPRNMFERNYPGQIIMEAADMAIDKEYKRIIIEDKISPILEPKVDIVKVTDEELEVNFTFITEPVAKLGEYKNLKVKKQTVKVTKEEVKSKIDTLLKGYAELIVKEDGEVQKDDIAIINFEGFKDGIAFDGGKGENYSLEIGSNTFIPGFEDGVIGMKKGETKDLNLTFPSEYGVEDLAGKEVVFKVTVNEIKTKVLPEYNDELVQMLKQEGVTTTEQFEEFLKENLKKQKEADSERNYTNECVAKAVENATVEVPQIMIDEETDRMVEDFKNRLAQQGFSFEMYSQMTGTDEEALRGQMAADAVNQVKTRLVLDAVANEKEIEVTEERIEEEYNTIAARYSMEVEKVKELIPAENLAYDLRLQAAIEVVKTK